MPEGWNALRLFVALGTQWRLAGMGGAPAGLDYAAVEPTARLMGLAVTPETFADLRAMERAALKEREARGK